MRIKGSRYEKLNSLNRAPGSSRDSFSSCVESEKLKKLYGNAIVTLIPEGNEVEVPSVGDRPSRLLAQRLLGEILEPRARELCEMLRDAMLEQAQARMDGASLERYATEIADHKRDPYTLVEEIVRGVTK